MLQRVLDEIVPSGKDKGYAIFHLYTDKENPCDGKIVTEFGFGTGRCFKASHDGAEKGSVKLTIENSGTGVLVRTNYYDDKKCTSLVDVHDAFYDEQCVSSPFEKDYNEGYKTYYMKFEYRPKNFKVKKVLKNSIIWGY